MTKRTAKMLILAQRLELSRLYGPLMRLLADNEWIVSGHEINQRLLRRARRRMGGGR